MKYIGTDYLYNLDVGKIAISFFTDAHIECVLLCSEKHNSVEVAISREFLYRKLNIPFTEKEYDVFDISSCIDYIFEDNDIRIKDDKFVINLVSEIADTVYRFEISLIEMCSLYLQEEKNLLHQLLKNDSLRQQNNEVVNSLFSLELLTETKSYVIRDNRGNDILKFKNSKFAQKGFNIICKGIVRYLRCLLS